MIRRERRAGNPPGRHRAPGGRSSSPGGPGLSAGGRYLTMPPEYVSAAPAGVVFPVKAVSAVEPGAR